MHENRLPGQSDWFHPASTTGIAGYVLATSVEAGAALGIAVSTTSRTYSIDVYRIGWYGGAGARLVLSAHDLAGQDHGQWRPNTFGLRGCATCTYDAATGLLQLDWPVSYTLRVPKTWLSGNYVARLTTPQGWWSYVPFIVRDARHSAVVAVMAVNTWQAYNDWGGKSLYVSNSFGPPTRGRGANAPAALQVTFERPYASFVGGAKQDYQTVEFLEREGYDVTYAGSVDLDRDAGLLKGHRIFLSVGHDEYWSRTAREAVESSRDGGLDIVFLSGNAVYWQVRYGPGVHGRERAVLICYRDASLDPASGSAPATTTVRWVDPPVEQAQDSLTGTLYTGRILPRPAPWVVAPTAPPWLLQGTGLVSGDSIADLVGKECDGVVTGTSHPYGWQVSAVHQELVLVSDSPVVTADGVALHCNTVYYRVPGGGQVFSAGTWSWQDFLTGRMANSSVIGMTEHVFSRFGA